MNRYRYISIALSISSVVFGAYYEPLLLYIIPLSIVVSWFYLRSRSYMVYPYGLSLACIAVLGLESIVYPAIFTSIILTPLFLEGGFRDLDHRPRPKDTLLFLGSTSLYAISSSLPILILSIFRFSLLITAVASISYILLRASLVRASSKSISIEAPERLYVLREGEANYIVRIENKSDISWMLRLAPYRDEVLSIYPDLDIIQLHPGRQIDIPILLRGSKIGLYRLSLPIVIMDNLNLVLDRLSIDLKVVVKPKLSIGIWVAMRFLETYGGRGDLESSTVVSRLFQKGRSGIFFGVRPFVQGDEPKYIHFKKSVEHQQLVTKEYEAGDIRPSILLVDTAVSSAEDLDEVLFNAVSFLLNSFVAGFGEIGMIMFNSREIILSLPPTAPLQVLREVIRKIEYMSVEERFYRFILDPPIIEALISSSEQTARFEYSILRTRLEESILGEAFKMLFRLSSESTRVISISSNSRYRNLYPLLGYMLRRYGHEYFPGIESLPLEKPTIDSPLSLPGMVSI